MDFETLLPIAVLLCVVGWHTWLVHSADLATPSGGGFAMFSSLDDAKQRHLRVQLRTSSDWVDATVPPEMDFLVTRARALPTNINLRAVADAVRAVSWTSARPTLAVVTRDSRQPLLEVRGVRVVLLKTKFEAVPPSVSMQVERTVEFR